MRVNRQGFHFRERFALRLWLVKRLSGEGTAPTEAGGVRVDRRSKARSGR